MKMLSVLLPFVLTFTSLTGWKVLNSKAGLYQLFIWQASSFISFTYLLRYRVYCHIMTCQLHWLPIRHRITYKLAVMMFKV